MNQPGLLTPGTEIYFHINTGHTCVGTISSRVTQIGILLIGFRSKPDKRDKPFNFPSTETDKVITAEKCFVPWHLISSALFFTE